MKVGYLLLSIDEAERPPVHMHTFWG